MQRNLLWLNSSWPTIGHDMCHKSCRCRPAMCCCLAGCPAARWWCVRGCQAPEMCSARGVPRMGRALRLISQQRCGDVHNILHLALLVTQPKSRTLFAMVSLAMGHSFSLQLCRRSSSACRRWPRGVRSAHGCWSAPRSVDSESSQEGADYFQPPRDGIFRAVPPGSCYALQPQVRLIQTCMLPDAHCV